MKSQQHPQVPPVTPPETLPRTGVLAQGGRVVAGSPGLPCDADHSDGDALGISWRLQPQSCL